MKNKPMIIELWNFMKTHKKWWLLPVIILLTLFGFLIILSQSSSISPFIYALG